MTVLARAGRGAWPDGPLTAGEGGANVAGMRPSWLVTVAVLAGARPVMAEAPARFPAPSGPDIVIESQPDRSTTNVAVLASLAGAGVLLGGVGLYFHLDSRSASDDVGANKPTNLPWTAADQRTYDRAHSSALAAGILYGLGGGLLVTAIVGLIVTEPKSETLVIHPHGNPQAGPTIAPVPGGGAVLGGWWKF